MFEVGQVIKKIQEPYTRDEIRAYSKASGDTNPIHKDEEFAVKVGLKGIIAQGMLTFGVINRYMSDLAKQSNASLIKIGCEMRGMVRPGDWLLTDIEVDSISDKDVSFKITQNSKMPLRLEKDGEIVKIFEAEEKDWIDEKEKIGIKTEETSDGTLTFREWVANKAWATIRLE